MSSNIITGASSPERLTSNTSACCDISELLDWLWPRLARSHPEVLQRNYGCGQIAPPLIEGARVLDLGCGSGRDSGLPAQLAGPEGGIAGVDRTDGKPAVAEGLRRIGFDDWFARGRGEHCGLRGTVAVAIGVGGVLLARRVAETMSMKISHLDHAQGISANLITATPVIFASKWDLLARP